jgi:di/tricarboxylate transporter
LDSAAVTTLVVLISAVGLLLSDRLRADVVALLAVIALGATGVLTPQETFSGFGRSAVITILAVFVLAEGLLRTGVTERVGSLLVRIAGSRESWLVLFVMLAGALLSLLMNNIAAASVLLPVVSNAGDRTGISSSRLMMPLAFGTLLGGMATLLTTTNIIASSLLRDHGVAGYGLLDFAPLGLPIVAVGLVYMVLVGRRLLPAQSPADRLQTVRQAQTSNLVDVYRLSERLFRARVPAGSTLVNKPLAQSSLREAYGVTVVAIERNGRTILAPAPSDVVRQDDIVLFSGNLGASYHGGTEPHLEILPPHDWREHDLESATIVVTEALLTPRSALIGQTLRQAHFREKYGMNVLAIWRGNRQMRTGVSEVPLQFGDALLLQGPRSGLQVLQGEPDFIVLANGKAGPELASGRRRWLALAVIGLTLLLAAVNSALVGEVMLGGALGLVVVGVLSMDQAYRAIEWKSVFLVAGMLPLSIAITKTGLAALLTSTLTSLLADAGPLALLAVLSLVAMSLTQVLNGAAVGAIIIPIAIQTAQHIGADPRSLTMGVVLATSMAFITPLGHPVSVLVMGPGGYSFRDYFRAGLPLAVLLFATVVLLLPYLWPLFK